MAVRIHGQDPVIRVTVDLVQVDAVVTDAKGRHVPDLTAGDFQIFEDGKLQKITNFSFVRSSAPKAAASGVEASVPDGTDPLRSADPFGRPVLRKEQVQRTIVLIADDLGLSAGDIPAVRGAMKRFVSGHLRAGDLVSIMTTSGGTGAAQRVTNDPRELLSAIDRVQYVAGRVGPTWYDPVHKIDAASEFENQSNLRLKAVRQPFLGSGTMYAVAYAIEGLHQMPGRKAIALFSDGSLPGVSNVVEMANRASVVIYTLDPRGVTSFSLTAVDFCKPPLCNPRTEEQARQAAYNESQRSMDQLARGTGGLFFHDDNDLYRLLAAGLDDLSDYYLIAYQPHREDFQVVGGRPQFHRIAVKVLQPGLTVRSRNGFFGVPEPASSAPAPESLTAHEALSSALRSPFQTAGFPVHLSAFYSASVGRNPKTHLHEIALRAMLAMDAHHIEFADAPGGKALNLEVAAAVYGPNNEVVARSDRTFTDTISRELEAELLASGLVYGLDIAIPRPGPYQLRVAVWDANSHRTASASSFVEIPDFNRPSPALSSLRIVAADAARNTALARAGVIGAGSSVTRVFSPGTKINYDSTLFGSKVESGTGKPRIDIELQLFRGTQQVYAGPAIPLTLARSDSPEAVHIQGEIKLPETFPPGEYAIELIAHDRLRGGRHDAAAQWTDFTLVTPAAGRPE